MSDLSLGFDDNLGIPADFARRISLKVKPYHHLSQMVSDFEKELLELIFIPVGVLPYLDKPYQIIAQASISKKNMTRLSASFVTTKNLTLAESIHFTIGRINPYCTTSFWGLLIALMPYVRKGASLRFLETDGFQDLFDKVASQAIDSGMIWDVILKKNENSNVKLHHLLTNNELPTPIIVSRSSLSSRVQHELSHFKSIDTPLFFNGFTTPNLDFINYFQQQMVLAHCHFDFQL